MIDVADFRALLSAALSHEQMTSVEATNRLVHSRDTVLLALREIRANELPLEVLSVLPYLVDRVLQNFYHNDQELLELSMEEIENLLVAPTPVVYSCAHALCQCFLHCFARVRRDVSRIFEFACQSVNGNRVQYNHAFELFVIVSTVHMVVHPAHGETPEEMKTIVKVFCEAITADKVMSGDFHEIYEIIRWVLPGILKSWWDIGLSDEVVRHLLGVMIAVCERVMNVAHVVNSADLWVSVDRLFQMVSNTFHIVGLPGSASERVREILHSDMYRLFFLRVLQSIPSFARIFACDCHSSTATNMLRLIERDFHMFSNLGFFEEVDHLKLLLEVLYFSAELSPATILEFDANPAMFYQSAFLGNEVDLRSVSCDMFASLSQSLFPTVVDFLISSRPSEGRAMLTASLCQTTRSNPELTNEHKQMLITLTDAVLSQDISALRGIWQYSRVFLLAEQLWLRSDAEVEVALQLVQSLNLLEVGVVLEPEVFDSRKFTLGCKICCAAVDHGKTLPKDLLLYLAERKDFCISADIWSLLVSGSLSYLDDSNVISLCLHILLDQILSIEMQKENYLPSYESMILHSCYSALIAICQKLGQIVNPQELHDFWVELRKFEFEADFYQFITNLCRANVRGLWTIVRTFPEWEQTQRENFECDIEHVRTITLRYLCGYPDEFKENGGSDFLQYFFEAFKTQWNVQEEVDLYLICEIIATMLQQKWLPPETLPSVIEIACELIKNSPVDNPTTVSAGIDLLMSASLFGGIDVFSNEFFEVWRVFVTNGGIISDRYAVLHRAFFASLGDSAKNQAFPILDAARSTPPNPNMDEKVYELADAPIPSELLNRLATFGLDVCVQ